MLLYYLSVTSETLLCGVGAFLVCVHGYILWLIVSVISDMLTTCSLILDLFICLWSLLCVREMKFECNHDGDIVFSYQC